MRATAKDLRFRTRQLLEAVERGEEVVITYRGKARARLVPLDTDAGVASRDTGLFGLWSDDARTADVEQYVEDLRRPRF